MDAYIPVYCKTIICGSLTRLDRTASKYALENDIELIKIAPDYDKYGKLAPLKANEEIINRADLVLAFWDGKSLGTKHLLQRCRYLGIKTQVIKAENH